MARCHPKGHRGREHFLECPRRRGVATSTTLRPRSPSTSPSPKPLGISLAACSRLLCLRKVLSAPANAPQVRRPTLSSLRSTWTYHRRAFQAWRKASLWNQLLILAILVYGIVFSVLTSLRILALSAFALDLGLYNQAMYTTVAYGRFFWVSGLGPAGGGSFFGGHFSPILFLVLAPYALAPSPFTLVVLQSWVIALGAIPIYRLAQRLLRSDPMAFAFAAVFLLDPAVQGVNWYDFHVEAFLLVTLPAMLYTYERQRWRWFLVFAILSLATLEMAAILVAVVAAVALASEAWGRHRGKRPFDRVRVGVLAGVILLCGLWLYAAGLIIQSMNPGSTYFSAGSSTWSILGASTALSIPAQILLHPDLAIAALTFDGTYKLWYLVVLFAPVQLLTFRSPRAMLFCVPWLGASLLSNFRGLYLVGNQYPAYVLPFVFYGAIVGMAQPWSLVPAGRRILRRATPHPPSEGKHGYARSLVGVTLVLLVVVSPLGPWAIGAADVGRAPVVTSHDRAILDLYELIPPSASVLTQNNLYPLLSDRLNVHFVPSNVEFPPGASFNETMDAWTSTVDYILVDTTSSFTEAAVVLSWPGISASYSLVAASDGAMLLERGNYSLSFYRPLTLSYDYASVTLVNGSVVPSSDTASGLALMHPNTTTSHFWYGPFVALPPGTYTVTYRIKVDRPAAGSVLALPVLLHPMNLLAQIVRSSSDGEQVFFNLEQLSSQAPINVTQLSGASIPAIDQFFSLSQNFTVQTIGAYEFPGLAASGGVTLWFDDLTIEQLSPALHSELPVVWS